MITDLLSPPELEVRHDKRASRVLPLLQRACRVVTWNRKDWTEWVKSKIDEGGSKAKVLKFGKEGEEEIDLAMMEQHFSMD